MNVNNHPYYQTVVLSHSCYSQPCPLRLNENSTTTNCNPTMTKTEASVGCNIGLRHRRHSYSTPAASIGGAESSNVNIMNQLVGRPSRHNATINKNYDHHLHLVASPQTNQTSRTKSRSKRSHYSTFTLLFTTLVALVSLTLFIDTAESLLSNTQHVNSCPLSACLCKWSNGKQGASCEKRSLRTIPTQLPSETQVLDMSGNHLTELSAHIFQERHLTNLQRLYLSECRLLHIADEAFAQLSNLVELDLSHNHLQHVPTKALRALGPALRKLNLAYNRIHVIESASFNYMIHLETLDLTHSHVTALKENAFTGLANLRELRISENNLTQLPLNVLVDLKRNTMIDLYANPWHCDCELRKSIEWMQRNQIQTMMSPACASPNHVQDIRWQNIKPEEFVCPPVILTKPEEIVVGAGSNVTLSCTAQGSSPMLFIWFQDQKNLSASSNETGNKRRTTLLEEMRYEILQEEMSPPNVTTSILFLMNLKPTDTSIFLCWVENSANYTTTTFSLVVNDSPPVHLTGRGSTSANPHALGFGNSLTLLFGLDGSSNSSQIIAIVLATAVGLLATATICLFVLKQLGSGNRSSKSSSNSNSDFKTKQVNGRLSPTNKFSQSNGKMVQDGQMRLASSDEDVGASDDDDDRSTNGGDSTSGSQSSCTKKGNSTRMLAVEELDGFIDYMRSGIINMDYHSMSPVIQFNKNGTKPAQVMAQTHRQLTQMNHFPSVSNASSQQGPYYESQPSNGSNSMATTISDLSPSSGSASTSFASNPHSMMVPQQQQQYVLASMAPSPLLRQQQTMTNCDFPTHNQPYEGQHELLTNPNYSHDYQGGHIGYSNGGDQMIMHQMMPPMYGGPYHPGQRMHYDPTLTANCEELLDRPN